jgi:hypothetical protein
VIEFREKTERYASGSIGPITWTAIETSGKRWLAQAYRPRDAARAIAHGEGATLYAAIEALTFDLGTLQGELRDGDACADAVLADLRGIEDVATQASEAERERVQREQAMALLSSKAAK